MDMRWTCDGHAMEHGQVTKQEENQTQPIKTMAKSQNKKKTGWIQGGSKLGPGIRTSPPMDDDDDDDDEEQGWKEKKKGKGGAKKNRTFTRG